MEWLDGTRLSQRSKKWPEEGPGWILSEPWSTRAKEIIDIGVTSFMWSDLDKPISRWGIRGLNKQINRFSKQVNSSFMYQKEEKDIWKSPVQFIEDGGGDCEDFALFYYASMLLLGWPSERLRLVVLWDSQVKEYHAVLLARMENEAFVFDNNMSLVYKLSIVVRRGVYKPIYLCNSETTWRLKKPDGPVRS